MIKTSKKQVSVQKSVQSPTLGLNAKDAIANMKETEAVVMENWFPTPSSVDIRKGRQAHVTGFPAVIDTLAFYNDGVDPILFAASDGNIYDATISGPVGAAVVTGLSNSRFQTTNFGTVGGFFLLMVNGQDKLQGYDGTNWWEDGDGTHDITGVDTSDISHINNFKNRVWLIEKDTFNAWYLPVASIAGAATNFDLSGLFRLGGYLMAMANWTIDNAAGIDDYAAFITSEGEVALYKGTDPSSANTWALVGTFRMGKPIGRRCFCKAGADVLVMTTDGAFPLSKSLLTDRSQLDLAASDKIANLINADVLMYQNNFGWQPILYPIGNKLIINVPEVEGLTSHQYVMNTTHSAWTKFTGWDAFCFEVLNDNLYFGGMDAVYQADIGQSDDDTNITAVCQQAFSYFGTRQQKKFQMVRPVFTSEGDIRPAVLMNVDFSQGRTTVSPSYTGNAGSEWDVSTWDVAPWTTGNNIIKKWQSVSGVGYSGGVRVVTESQNLSCQWQSTDIVFEVGGVL